MKKLWKRALIILCLCLTGILVFRNGAVREERDGLQSDPALYGTMDENGVFQIYTVRDLEWFCRYAENGFEDLDAALMKDLDMGGTAYYVSSYSGCFDGRGHGIANRSAAYELFIKVEKEGVIKNLNFENVRIVSRRYGRGGVASHNYGVIENCSVSGYVEGVEYTGGIVSKNFGMIRGCVNRADVVCTEAGKAKWNGSSAGEYGAGGIAGYCATPENRDDEGAFPENTFIADCVNEGSVTAQTLAAGICGWLSDRTGEFLEEDGLTQEAQEHNSVYNCRNYGGVMVNRMVDVYGFYTRAAGICGYIYWGNLYHCANLGNISISEDARKVSESGWVYANYPNAIADTTAFAPEHSYIEDCVSLKGTVANPMRHDNIMEITRAELEEWERGELSYVSDSWRFDLEEAVRVCSLEPLGVSEALTSIGKENIYMTDAFSLCLPQGFQIVRKTVDGGSYALRINWNGERKQDFEEKYGSVDYEAWLLRKQADMDAVLEWLYSTNAPMESYFVENVYNTLPNIHALRIETFSVPMSGTQWEEKISGRSFLGYGMSNSGMRDRMWEGDHALGNMLSACLEGNAQDGYEVKWILLFANSRNNIHPSNSFIQEIQEGFCPLTGKESSIKVKRGDSLSALAQACLGDGGAWRELAVLNGVNNPDYIYEGQTLMLPDPEEREKRAAGLDIDTLLQNAGLAP